MGKKQFNSVAEAFEDSENRRKAEVKQNEDPTNSPFLNQAVDAVVKAWKSYYNSPEFKEDMENAGPSYIDNRFQSMMETLDIKIRESITKQNLGIQAY